MVPLQPYGNFRVGNFANVTYRDMACCLGFQGRRVVIEDSIFGMTCVLSGLSLAGNSSSHASRSKPLSARRMSPASDWNTGARTFYLRDVVRIGHDVRSVARSWPSLTQ